MPVRIGSPGVSVIGPDRYDRFVTCGRCDRTFTAATTAGASALYDAHLSEVRDPDLCHLEPF